MSHSRFKVDGAICLVTGASGGIGAATARLLARSGARLILQGRDEERLRQVAGETGGTALALDLTGPEAPESLFAQAKRVTGRIDVLVNNAGLGWAGPFADMPLDRLRTIISLNLVAPLALTQAALRDMIPADRGRIVFVSSIAGYLGVRDEAVYSATKAAILTFADSVRAEIAGTAVKISVVSPTVIDTAFFANRGLPYARSWPRPLPASEVAEVIRLAIEDGRAEAVVPPSMWVSIRLKALLPSLYRTLAGRYG